jgi:hypothetical protein
METKTLDIKHHTGAIVYRHLPHFFWELIRKIMIAG